MDAETRIPGGSNFTYAPVSVFTPANGCRSVVGSQPASVQRYRSPSHHSVSSLPPSHLTRESLFRRMNEKIRRMHRYPKLVKIVII